ncbi:MAG: transposase [Chloroflexi bacterium RBG_16_50_11]|nr:MAG: transposase [Chloroflexi bacterium RBG_16_50_11]
MKFAPDVYHRHSIRLKNFDYSQPGAYFVTIAAYQRVQLFGVIKENKMFFSSYGKIVQSCWEDIPNHYFNVSLDSFIVMPNHIHGIIIITDHVGAAPTKKYPLSEIIRAFKTFSARRTNTIRETPGLPVWQRNYYEHIIRDEKELYSIRDYIENNFLEWNSDEENQEIL